MNRNGCRAAVTLLAAWLATPAQAGPMLQPTDATTDMGSAGVFLPERAINQSGLEVLYTSGVTNFDEFVPATSTQGGTGIWYSASGDTTGNFDFALGATYLIESFAYWADPQGLGQSVDDFRLLADDNAEFSSPVLLGTFVADDGTGDLANNFGQVFEFWPTSASHVRMQILSNHGGSVTGISEAAFEVVPEPASSALLGVALGLLALRRRQGLISAEP